MPSALDLVLTALNNDDRGAALRHLRGEPDPAAVLAQVAQSRSPGPRGYVAGLAAGLLPRELAIPLVRKMLDDSDPSNRIDAVPIYMALDPDGMPPLIAKLRRRLRSTNDHEVLSTAWDLAALGDVDARVPVAPADVSAWSANPVAVLPGFTCFRSVIPAGAVQVADKENAPTAVERQELLAAASQPESQASRSRAGRFSGTSRATSAIRCEAIESRATQSSGRASSHSPLNGPGKYGRFRAGSAGADTRI